MAVPAPLPPDEGRRLERLLRLGVLDSDAEPLFDALTNAASLLTGAPIALLTLVDERRQWFKSNVGLEGTSETPRDIAFCSYTILGDELFVVPDALQDPRFADNPLVTNAPNIRFYAGAPITLADGLRMGSLCVIDRLPRQLAPNHLLHLVAIARAAGIELRWDDFDALSSVIPLLARVYPNGYADVNQFHEAGGMAFLIDQLLSQGLLHADARTVFGTGMDGYTQVPHLDEHGALVWTPVSKESGNRGVLRGMSEPFRPDGGLRMLTGNLGRAVIKVSSVPEDRLVIEAPAIVFHDQDDVRKAFERGELNRDFVAVVRFQGPQAIGMPELHKLTPTLSVLQDRGHRIALLTDGRMSGASGRVPAAIHVTPEAEDNGPIARIRDGDIVRLDAIEGRVDVLVEAAEFASRVPATADLSAHQFGLGRELFGMFRRNATTADLGAGVF